MIPEGKSSVQIDIFRPGDEADILALNRLEYGPTDFMAKPENFEWRLHGNPAEPTIICLARDAGTRRVIGYMWIIPVRMRLFGRDELGAIIADLIVHPEYRNGIAHAMLVRRRQQIIREKKIALHYSFPTAAYLKKSRQMEEIASFPVGLAVKPSNLKALAAHFKKRSWQKYWAGWAGRMIQPFFFRGRPVKRDRFELAIERPGSFDERFDDFWLRARDKYPVMAVRNRAFLSWRFAPVAGRKYHILAAAAADGIAGYAVIRCTHEIRDIPIGLVSDILLEPGPRGEYAGQLLLAEADAYFRSEKVWLAGGLILPHTAEFRALYRSGYRFCPKRLAPREFNLKFMMNDVSLPKTSEIRATDWFVSIASYESY